MSILEELGYGNIEPSEYDAALRKEYKEAPVELSDKKLLGIYG